MFESLTDVETLVHDFEATELPRSQWNHRAHLAIASWYLSGLPEEEAAERFIGGLRRYNYAHGIGAAGRGGYHETMTLFWLSLARSFLEQSASGLPRLDAINALVTRFANRADLIYAFYRPETLEAFEARRGWVEPDRKPLEIIDLVCQGCEP